MVEAPSPAPEPEPSRRQAAKQGTREALLQAASAEFAEKGLDVPSLDSICARAGFTRGAFYVHFRDREDLVAAVMERVLGVFLDAVIGGEGGDVARTITRFSELAVHGIEDTGGGSTTLPGLPPGVPFHQILAACQRSEGTRAQLVATLATAAARLTEGAAADQRAGRLRGDLPPRELAVLLLLLSLGVRAAADLRLPVDVAATRSALLRLLGI